MEQKSQEKEHNALKEPQSSLDCPTEAELRYRILFEQAPYGILIIDTDGRILEFNEAAHRDLGYTRDEFANLAISDLDPDEGPEEVQAKISEVLKDEKADFIKRHRTKDGEIRIVHIITQAMSLSGRTVFHTIWRDVTEHNRMEQALRESEGKYRDLFENANDAIFITDAELNCIDANKRASELFGFAREEFLKMNVFDVVTPNQVSRVEEALNRLREELTHDRFVGKMLTKEGTLLDIEVSSSAIMDGDHVVGARHIVRDITKRKRTEEALRASEAFLQTIIENEPECVKLLAHDGSLLMMNRAGLKMIEAASFDQVKGKSIHCLVTEGYRDAFTALTEDVFRGKTGTLEFAIVGLGGRHLWLETHAVPLRNENGEIIALLGVTRDITVRKRLEEDLIRAQKLESVGILAGGIAHDFNNLLTAILGNISLAKTYVGAGDRIHDRLVSAENATVRAKGLTQQLLTFSRGGAPVRKIVSLGDVVKESIDFSLRGSDLRCTVSIPPNLWPVEIDEGQIGQVINNLIINACQAMPGGGVITVECRNVTIGKSDALPLKEGNYVQLSVSDQGVGIPRNHLTRIFDPYFTTKQEGSGLGLATSYSIVKRHDGYIDVQSEPGAGTIFHVYLPASASRPAVTVEDEAPLIGRERVLLMDDEESVRTVAREMLVRLGYEVEVAGDGAQAVMMYRRAKEAGEPFHVVIMDLTVPGGLGGAEAITQLSEIDPSVRAIVSSGYSNDEIMADYRQHGFAGVITKPYTLRELSVEVKKATEGEPRE
ncbi:MAG TPA: PAS domain S-box protein [Thermodesulfovibrionales bacterium]|nr:PAS domain S-box protein [Thermodesulfovibrionales bacterium]